MGVFSNLAQQNTGQASVQSGGGIFARKAQEQESKINEEPGFLKGIARDIVKPFARLGTNVVQAGQGLATGKQDLQPFSGSFLGEVKPVGMEGSFGEKLKDSAGTGLQVASNIPVVKGVGITLGGIKSAVKTGGVKALAPLAKPLAQEGAFAGGSYTTGKALEEQETIPRAFAKGVLGATGGAAVAPVLGLGVSAIGGLGKNVAKEVAAYLDPEKAVQQVESKVLQKYEKGVRPLLPGKSTSTQLKDYRSDVMNAVQTIKENKPNLTFNDEAGEVIAGQNPKSLQQFTDAVEQTKKNIFEQYNNLAKQAGDSGVGIETKTIAKELDSVVNNRALALTNPEAIKYAKATQVRYNQAGKLDAVTAQDVIQNYNKSLEAFYRNPSYDNASKAAIDAMVANNMRKALDEGITGLTGTQYSVLKKKYGALKAVEKDVIKATLRDARKNTKGLVDFTDIFSGGQLVNGMLALNPATMAQGLTAKAIAEFYKYLNNPNRAIEKMFDLADRLPQLTDKTAQIANKIKPTKLKAPIQRSAISKKRTGASLVKPPIKSIKQIKPIMKSVIKSKLPNKPPKLR